MASVSTYLNFDRNTEEAFNFYKSVFGGEFFGQGIMRMSDAPPQEGMPPLPEEDKNLVMHVELNILGKHSLMGTDAIESMGFKFEKGNNVSINLMPDTRKETKELFDALSAGGLITVELQDMFWGDYFGTCTDKFGIQWMFNCSEKK
ncbi:MAG: VOC family protein [Cyclobacteriaceae bacterium]